MIDIGSRILARRKHLNITQKQLAQKTGITEATLSRYENNLREPKAEIIALLAKVLETTTDYLLCNTHNPNPYIVKEAGDSYTVEKASYSIDISGLPEEAVEEIQNFVEYIRHKYRLKK